MATVESKKIHAGRRASRRSVETDVVHVPGAAANGRRNWRRGQLAARAGALMTLLVAQEVLNRRPAAIWGLTAF